LDWPAAARRPAIPALSFAPREPDTNSTAGDFCRRFGHMDHLVVDQRPELHHVLDDAAQQGLGVARRPQVRIALKPMR